MIQNLYRKFCFEVYSYFVYLKFSFTIKAIKMFTIPYFLLQHNFIFKKNERKNDEPSC